MKAALIVEDLPDIRTWLGEVAQEAFPGLRLTLASRFSEGVSAIGKGRYDLALIDLGLPDGSGTDLVAMHKERQPEALPVVVSIYDDDEHLFPALQAGAFGYLLKEQPREQLVAQLVRITQGEPPLSPPIARRVLGHFAGADGRRAALLQQIGEEVHLTDREADVLQRVAKGYTLAEIAQQFGLSRNTIAVHVKNVYRKLNVSSRAEAALEAARRGLVKP